MVQFKKNELELWLVLSHEAGKVMFFFNMCNMYILFYKSMSAVHLCELTGSFREMAASHLAEVGGVLSEHDQELDHGWQNTFWRCVSSLLPLLSHLYSKT